MLAMLLSEQQAREVQTMMKADRLVKIKFGEGRTAIEVCENIGSCCETTSLVVSPGPYHEQFGKQHPERFTSYEHFLIAYGLSVEGLPLGYQLRDSRFANSA